MTEYSKEALQFVAEQAVTANDGRVVHDSINRTTFLVNEDGNVKEYRPNNGAEEALRVHTLNAICDYILNTKERADDKLIIEVKDEDTVKVYGELDSFGNREVLLQSDALHPDFPFDRFMSPDDFNIRVLSMFYGEQVNANGENIDDNKALLLKVVGNLKQDNSIETKDDGVSQTATVKTGPASVATAVLPSPIKLTPYRTFPEIDQPSSNFIFRLKDGPMAALFEGDGGAWRNEAIANIAQYLTDKLDSQLDRLTILA
jgi:hypothetical protein